MDVLMSVHDHVLDFLINGLTGLSGWWMLGIALLTTHITIASVTIYLHRCMAHRALELHTLVSHFFRFWLWMTTGMVTKEWVAIHRKHHAKCETVDDPHSPVTRGIKTVLLRGSELYRAEAKVEETKQKYGHNCPDDWVERKLYSRFPILGVSITLILDVTLFGVGGLAVWALQMAWIPVTAAGVINGIGHFWGYRNFEAADASTNIVPWGILIGGEELHNNHHTYPTSAKLSVKKYEFDIGWLYIRTLQVMGLAKVRKLPPQMVLGATQPAPDARTLDAIVANRYELMAQYAKTLRGTVSAELQHLREQGQQRTAAFAELSLVKRWLHRDEDKIPTNVRPRLSSVLGSHRELGILVSMREELRQLWTRTHVTRDQLVSDLQAWCSKAETSGIAALREFSTRVRSLAPA
ncbi:DesA family fatty acid desaturase [Amphibiibacter pelophylacis]|uniref:Fatty acid desaturase n=1 Tax=Amphibiibacter pelophylacis TaxID=1799477 RepID=A0ACC6P3H7_9BURK